MTGQPPLPAVRFHAGPGVGGTTFILAVFEPVHVEVTLDRAGALLLRAGLDAYLRPTAARLRSRNDYDRDPRP